MGTASSALLLPSQLRSAPLPACKRRLPSLPIKAGHRPAHPASRTPSARSSPCRPSPPRLRHRSSGAPGRGRAAFLPLPRSWPGRAAASRACFGIVTVGGVGLSGSEPAPSPGLRRRLWPPRPPRLLGAPARSPRSPAALPSFPEAARRSIPTLAGPGAPGKDLPPLVGQRRSQEPASATP